MRNQHSFADQRGFTLLEVAVAGSVALMIIFALFSAVRTAGDQYVVVEKKKDQLNFLADLKYVLGDKVLCKDRLEIPDRIEPGQPLKLWINKKLTVKAKTDMLLYGIHVDKFNIHDGALVREVMRYKKGQETWELRGHRLTRISPPEDEPFSPEFPKISHDRYSFMDTVIETRTMGKKPVHFRPERLARVTVHEHWDEKMKTPGFDTSCISVGKVIEPPVPAPLDVMQRVGASMEGVNFGAAGRGNNPQPSGLGYSGGITKTGTNFAEGSAIEKLTRKVEELMLTQRKQGELVLQQANQEVPGHNGTGGGGGGSNGGYNVGPALGGGSGAASSSNYSGGSDSVNLERVGELIQQRELAQPQPQQGRELASLTPPPAPVGGGSAAKPPLAIETSDQDPVGTALKAGHCAVNMNVKEAVEHGMPLILHGETTEMPLGECMGKKYVCMSGSLRDLGLPPAKLTNCNGTAELNNRDVAKQISAKAPKSAKPLDCAINKTAETAHRMHLPTFKSGERLLLDAGECLEKSYVCWDGLIKDEGQPARPKDGCRPLTANSN